MSAAFSERKTEYRSVIYELDSTRTFSNTPHSDRYSSYKL